MKSTQGLAFELQNALGQLRRSHALQSGHTNLRGAEKHILFMICELKNDQPITISKIARKIGVTLAAVTHLINTLEKQGLIRRLSDKKDRRSVLIELTKKGIAQVVTVKKEMSRKTKILASFLGEKDTKELIRLVQRIATFQGNTK